MRVQNQYVLLALFGVLLTLSACGDKNKTEAKGGTQVVAKVNGDEISIHQINFQLNRLAQSKGLTEAQSKDAAKQILARLVDQQLLKQQATETKLDRDPRILQAVEASKNEILAQAYLEQMLSKAAKPSITQVDAFYKERPELFENRRVFRLQELAINVTKDKHAEIAEKVATTKNINEIAAWLKEKNYPFNANSNVRAAEQLPLDFLKKLQPLKDGDLIAVSNENSVSIVHLAASQSMPITREKATPVIEQYFLNQNKAALAKKEMAALNEKANIEFIGAFADMKKGVQPAPTAIKKSDTKASQLAQPVAAQEMAKPVDPAQAAEKPAKDASSMDKGLSGL
ncbi:MAG: peptidyl-prolyl cis-trans isomerase, EpsD family [Methylotenera sp.]|nr:MAG: peptidyl-prolyl cis-trans isomerase, EpsD family [Methylotenera sp.]